MLARLLRDMIPLEVGIKIKVTKGGRYAVELRPSADESTIVTIYRGRKMGKGWPVDPNEKFTENRT